MNTYALQVTEKGDINLIPEYPVEPNRNDYGNTQSETDFFCRLYLQWSELSKKALANPIPVKNKEYAQNLIIDLTMTTFSNIDEFTKPEPGIYPYNGEVKIKNMLQVRHGVEWHDLPNQKEGRDPEGIYRTIEVAILVEPNTPEKPDSSEELIYDLSRVTDQQQTEIESLKYENQVCQNEIEQLRASNKELREENNRLKANQSKQNLAIVNHLCDKTAKDETIKELVEALSDVLKYDYDHLLDNGVSAITARLSKKLRKLISKHSNL